MSAFEYKIVPAPKRGLKAKGVKGSEARFANALETVMNAYGEQGWQYQRTDTLPSEERSGLTRRTTVYQNMLVFRRAVEVDETADAVSTIVAPVVMPEPSTNTPEIIATRDDVEEATTDNTEDTAADTDSASVEDTEASDGEDEKTVAAE